MSIVEIRKTYRSSFFRPTSSLTTNGSRLFCMHLKVDAFEKAQVFRLPRFHSFPAPNKMVKTHLKTVKSINHSMLTLLASTLVSLQKLACFSSVNVFVAFQLDSYSCRANAPGRIRAWRFEIQTHFASQLYRVEAMENSSILQQAPAFSMQHNDSVAYFEIREGGHVLKRVPCSNTTSKIEVADLQVGGGGASCFFPCKAI